MIAFDNFYTIDKRNEYSTKQAQTVSLQPYDVSTLPGKTKNGAKRPTAYSSTFRWTDCSKRSQKVVQCFICFFPSLLENSFSSLLADNILHSMGFYQKFIFKLNMVNFSTWTKVKLSWFATCHSYNVIEQLSK